MPIKRYIRCHTSSTLVSLVASYCEKFLRAYFNEDYYEFRGNGEEKVLRTVCDFLRNETPVILDVGANKGSWALDVLDCRQDATIYCFEIVPATAKKLSELFSNYPNVRVCDFGLSFESREVEVFWNKTADDTSSISPRHRDPLFAEAEVAKIQCHVELGDAVIDRLGLKKIDLLKIDVEGHEVEVLQGLKKTLGSPALAPKVIQFEYGVTFIPPRHTLQEIYQLLEPYNYAIGRLHPTGVKFKKYQFKDDHFRMGNYIATHFNRPLMQQLSRF